MTAAPKRRWFRFSLRTMFVVTTLIACWLGVQANGIFQQRRAIEMVRKHGGRVNFRHQRVSKTRFDRSLELTTTTPRWLRKLIGDEYFMEVVDVFLRDPPFNGVAVQPPSNDELALLGSLTALEELRLVNIPITDEVFRKLRGLTNLTLLSVSDGKLTDASMQVIGRFQHLQTLCVDSSMRAHAIPIDVTNKGLRAIAHLDDLEELWLRGTLVDDAGLAHLSGFQKLWMLDLSNTGVTDSGLAHLARLPRLRIFALRDTGVGDEGIRTLSTAPALQQLIVTNTQITDQSLLILESLPRPVYVVGSGTFVTPAGRSRFEKWYNSAKTNAAATASRGSSSTQSSAQTAPKPNVTNTAP